MGLFQQVIYDADNNEGLPDAKRGAMIQYKNNIPIDPTE